MARCALSRSADSRTLDALGAAGLKAVPLLRGEAGDADWRLVEVWTDSGLPFELHLEWSSGTSGPRKAQLTVSRAARVCVFARSLALSAANLADATNQVNAAVADALIPTRNQLEVRGATVQLTQVLLTIPAFATHLRVELVEPTHLPDLQITVCDGTATLCGVTQGDAQPPEGVPMGGARVLTLLSPHAEEFRAIFTLAL